MTTDDIAADRAVIAAATPGPWRHVMRYSGGEWRELILCPGEEIQTSTSSSASFIARARTGWPAALDEVERLRAELAKVTAERDAATWKREQERWAGGAPATVAAPRPGGNPCTSCRDVADRCLERPCDCVCHGGERTPPRSSGPTSATVPSRSVQRE